MAASREKVLYFEPQPSEQTAALKTVLVRMGVRIKNVEAVSAGQTVGWTALPKRDWTFCSVK